MISLAMDTAGTVCAACLYDSASGRVLAEVSEEIGRGHAERLMGIISDVLDKAKISYNDIGKIVTTIGPGSFTGIRVGVATARGFGVGLGIPVVGVTNLEAVAVQAKEAGRLSDNAPLGVVLEAGRGQAYCQFTVETTLAPANTPFMTPKVELAKVLEADWQEIALAGTAAQEVATMMNTKPRIIDVEEASSIEIIAHIGAERDQGDKRPEPLYLRKPDAKPQTGFAVERS